MLGGYHHTCMWLELYKCHWVAHTPFPLKNYYTNELKKKKKPSDNKVNCVVSCGRAFYAKSHFQGWFDLEIYNGL